MSAARVNSHEGAAADVKSAVDWYRERSARAASAFIEELARATELIREAPARWPMGKNRTRRFLLSRFPFSIIYSEEEGRGYDLGRRPCQPPPGVLEEPPRIIAAFRRYASDCLLTHMNHDLSSGVLFFQAPDRLRDFA